MKDTILYGHEKIKEEIDAICANSKAYSIGGIRPVNFIIYLDKGNGRTTLARYITEMFYKYNIIRFSGIDLYLEINFDGTLNQLRESFGDICFASCYANNFEGVLFFDVDALSNHINETQVEYFIKEIMKISKSATLIFYVPEQPSRNSCQLNDKILSVLKNTNMFNDNPYTITDLALITEKMINKQGIEIEKREEFHKSLLSIIRKMDIKTISEVCELARKIITYSDYSTIIPKVNDNLLNKVCV